MRKKAKYWFKQILQTAVVLLLVSLAVDWWRKPEQPAGFSDEQVHTLSGRRFTLAELSRNRTVVVYFWGSWCGVCKHTSPVINRLHQAGVPVLGVAMQSGEPEEVQNYMRNQGLDFETVNDPRGQTARQWRVAVTPTVVVMKNGKTVHNTTGLSSYWGLRSRVWLADRLY
ncbi:MULTISPECIES: protein disulfide oxidoreductase [unclassified Neisseria]|uniref:protein disulfide oxidoreductase n=1 Tax=unclassified Neisseria TaxID=2623750 RepID=UPI002666A1C1|nr:MULTISPECIES: protein disulfide oxidoreductase [unclassified Neisseria]MDO1509849.1 protein disulfide oxidoreductase [Neisseria sp. MVDL19-042950]MDO1516046.1 protein disulfide oxidoreductase [Neisseria sp. MVDL18-041461]MDO1563162.1 protein disulfide oxidoreductase [Neisseria sp. MVDL20-010259]